MNTLDESQAQQSQSLLHSPTQSPAVAATTTTTTTTLHQGTDEEEQWETATVHQNPEAAPEEDDETQLDTQSHHAQEDEDEAAQDAQQIGAFAFAAAEKDDWISTKATGTDVSPADLPARPAEHSPMDYTLSASLPLPEELSEDFQADADADVEVAAATERAATPVESMECMPDATEGDKTPLQVEEEPMNENTKEPAAVFVGAVSPLAQLSTEQTQAVLIPGASHAESVAAAEEAEQEVPEQEVPEEAEQEVPEQEVPEEAEQASTLTTDIIQGTLTSLEAMGYDCTLAATALQQVKSRARSAEELFNFSLDWFDQSNQRSKRSNAAPVTHAPVTVSATHRTVAAALTRNPAPVPATTTSATSPARPKPISQSHIVNTMRLRSVHFRAAKAAKKQTRAVSSRKVTSRNRKASPTTSSRATATPAPAPAVTVVVGSSQDATLIRNRSSRIATAVAAAAASAEKRQIRFYTTHKRKLAFVTQAVKAKKARVVKRCSTLCLATRAGSQNLALRPVSRLLQ
jgi:hypothetical protein